MSKIDMRCPDCGCRMEQSDKVVSLTPKAPPMQGHPVQEYLDAIAAAEARGYERGLAEAAKVAESVNRLEHHLDWREIAAAIRSLTIGQE